MTLVGLREAIEQINAYYDELNGESPRAAAILAVSSLEDALEMLIRSRFPNDLDQKSWSRIAGPGFTPLGSFKAKNDVAEAFGFYGSKTRIEIENIASVRNKFAHSSKPRKFNDPDILKKCQEIGFSDASGEFHEDDIRLFFLDRIQELQKEFERILMYVPELDREPPPPLP